MHLDGGRYDSGPQARCRAVLATNGHLYLSLILAVGSAHSGWTRWPELASPLKLVAGSGFWPGLWFRRPLAGRAFASLSPAPLAGPIGAKAPRNALLKVAICHAKISTSYGVLLYRIIGGGARVGWLGPCTLVRAKLNNANWFYA